MKTPIHHNMKFQIALEKFMNSQTSHLQQFLESQSVQMSDDPEDAMILIEAFQFCFYGSQIRAEGGEAFFQDRLSEIVKPETKETKD